MSLFLCKMNDDYLDLYTLKPGQYRELKYSKYLSAVYLDVDKATKLYFPRDLVPPPVVHDYTIDKNGATFTMTSHEKVPTYIWESRYVPSANDFCMILVRGPNNHKLYPKSYIAYHRKFFKETVLANTTKSPGDYVIGFKIAVYSDHLLLPEIYCFKQDPLYPSNQAAQQVSRPKPIQFSFSNDEVFYKSPPRKKIFVNDGTSPFKKQTKDWYHEHTSYHPRQKLISNDYSGEVSESSDNDQNAYDPREAEYRDYEVRNQKKISPSGVYMSTDKRPGTKSVVARKTNGSLQEYRVGKRAMSDIQRKHSYKYQKYRDDSQTLNPRSKYDDDDDEYSSESNVDDDNDYAPRSSSRRHRGGFRDRTREQELHSYESQDNSNIRTPERSSRKHSSSVKTSQSVKFGKSFKPYREKFTPQFKGNVMNTTFDDDSQRLDARSDDFDFENRDEYSRDESSEQYEEDPDPEPPRNRRSNRNRNRNRNSKINSNKKRKNFFDRFKK